MAPDETQCLDAIDDMDGDLFFINDDIVVVQVEPLSTRIVRRKPAAKPSLSERFAHYCKSFGI